MLTKQNGRFYTLLPASKDVIYDAQQSLPDSELEPGGRRDLSELIESAEDCCTEAIPLNLPESFKRRLEQDQLMVNSKRKLVRLPAQPNIIRHRTLNDDRTGIVS